MHGMKDTHGGNIWEAAQKAGLSPEGIVDFSASINPAGLCQGAREAVRKALKLAASYPDPYAIELKKALSSYYGISAEEVLPGNGSTELIYLIPQILKPKKALIIEPAFSEYRKSLECCGCKVDSLVLRERDGFLLGLNPLRGLSRVKKAILKIQPDIVYVCNPSNPTGVLTEKRAIVDLAGFCEKAGAALVVDEAFMDFCEGLNPLRGQSVKK